ncbi:MAG: N4-gp56 family major capsid protein [Candidatus Dojkabacteria bacterium]
MATTVSATDTEITAPVNNFYNRLLLQNARPLAPYFIGTTPGELSENAGTKVIKWRRFDTSADHASGIAPTTTALSEITTTASYMQGRSSDTVHISDVTATVAKYGQFYILNEEVDVHMPNNTMAGITRSLGISAGRSLNQLQRNQVEDNSTIIYAGNVASDGLVASAITVNTIAQAINVLTKNSGMPFTPMSTGSTGIGTNPILPGFWGITNPDVAYDIANLSGFKSVETYAGQVDTVPGEFGTLATAGFTVRFIQTPEASIDTESGAAVGSTGLNGTTNIDLYTTVIYGQDAIGSVGLGRRHTDGIYRGGDDQAAIELIAKGRGTSRPSGTSDPYDEIMTLAWKAFHSSAILNSNWTRGIRSGATNLTA